MSRPLKWPDTIRRRAREIRAKYGFGKEVVAKMLSVEFNVNVPVSTARNLMQNEVERDRDLEAQRIRHHKRKNKSQ